MLFEYAVLRAWMDTRDVRRANDENSMKSYDSGP